MTLKQGTLFGIIGAAVKIVTIVAELILEYWMRENTLGLDFYLYMLSNSPLKLLISIFNILAYVAFGLFFITLYKKQK